MTKEKIDFSIIIPAYNEEQTIREIVKKVKEVPYPGKAEIIIVDDCSTKDGIRAIYLLLKYRFLI